MNVLSPLTLRRLQRLQQVPAVWEGDRSSLVPKNLIQFEDNDEAQRDCILWVDGTESVVRATDLVPVGSGHEAMVRSLLRAMEMPQGGGHPARPQKIVVRNRELQFYLRGILQDLDINVDYATNLPIVDEILRDLRDSIGQRPPSLPPQRAQALLQTAYELWQDAPWAVMDEEKILSIQLNYGDVETLYASVLGLLGQQYGILLYRSLESLKQFRRQVISSDSSSKQIEEIFLEQDCFFITFDPVGDEMDYLALVDFDEDDDDPNMDPVSRFQAIGIQPEFGSLHPLEGIRSVLYEEEADAVLLALTALHRFFKQRLARLDVEKLPKLNGRYRIPDPSESSKMVSIKVATMPEVTEELAQLGDDMPDLEELEALLMPSMPPMLRDDLIPNDAFFSLGAMPWEVVQILRDTVDFYQPADGTVPEKADGLPIILIQTTRPKAKKIMERIDEAGGLQGIGFSPGRDEIHGMDYDLGILKMVSNELFLFGEFDDHDTVHTQAKQKWDQRCKKTKGYCGLVIAKGVTGAARGNPGLREMVGLFEVPAFSPKDLGLGRLMLMPRPE